MIRPSLAQLRKLVGVANYQFGKGIGSVIFDRRVLIECSKRTGRIRHIYRDGQLVATLRPKDGYLALTTNGANILLTKIKSLQNVVVVQDDVSEVVKNGGDVFAKHVVQADASLRPAEEVIVIDQRRGLLGVGRAVLSGTEMRYFKRGVAVRLRRGVQRSPRAAADLGVSPWA